MSGIVILFFWFCFLAVVYPYAIYPLVLPLMVKLFKKKNIVDDSLLPTVAVVVPIFNEEKVVLAKIKNIFALEYPSEKLSVWIGSDASTDATHELVTQLPNPQVHLWIAPQRGGKTEVINNLAPQINAEILLFTDANTMHEPDSLRKMVRHFSDSTVGGVAGHIRHALKGNDRFGETTYRSYESRQKMLESCLHSTISAYGGFYCIRKSLFKQIPYNAYSNDDVLIPMNIIRQKKRMMFDYEAVSYEDNTQHVKSEFSRRIRIGAGNFQAFFWLLDFLNPLKGWPFFCYVSHKVGRWFSPFFLFGAMASSIALLIMHAGFVYTLAGYATLGFIGMALVSKIVPIKLFGYASYFLTMNCALALGLFRYVRGIKSAAWTRTERT